jgi:dihydrofolate synthase/folylpolyglutamate synthase
MVNIPHWPTIPIWQIPRKPDLSTSIKLLDALDNPHKKLPPTIHIAGTNGKGSTVSMLKSIFMQSGYKVHSYTSPHLINFNERIKLADCSISDDHLYSILERVKAAADKLNLEPSFFEGTTAAAFLAFSESNADILLLETGMGGRLDCTNVIDNPLLTIITPISYDHMEFLGNDLLQIASEKAGIIKHNTPCVIGAQTSAVYKLLLDKCNKMQASSFCYEYDYGVQKTERGFRYISKKHNLDFPPPNLEGEHQILNATSVIAATMLINDKFRITTHQLTQGLVSTSWPGRLQLIEKEKTNALAGNNIKIYLDGAHNNAGALCLSNWASNLKGKVYIILGMTRNRDVESFCTFFKDIVYQGAAVTVESEPSSYSASIVAKKASKTGIPFIEANSLQEAIKDISINNNEEPATIIITGSLFLIADFYKL